MPLLRHAWVIAFSALLVIEIGCGAPGVPLPPELELPKPVADLHAQRKGSKVFLSWSVPAHTTDGRSIRRQGDTQVCRSLTSPLEGCGIAIGTVSPSPASPSSGQSQASATYNDTLPDQLQREHPDGEAVYGVVALNAYGRSAGLSNPVEVPLAPTLPPPANFSAQLQASGILLTWAAASAPNIDGLRYTYRIYRREKGHAQETKISEQPLNGGASEFLDQAFAWEKTYVYRITIATLVERESVPEMQVEGDDSAELEVLAHDVFPPAVPARLQAVASGVGQPPFIDLIWTPDNEADLAGYNIYRREEGGPEVRINSMVVQAPAYRDSSVVSGHRYFYSVAAVDQRGNESSRSNQASDSVP